ncbi:unnamed protein product [Thlaspi arvense]|uniref:Cation/H+ exchanger domain-containing protein n=1 Tax=Thlaspi arvense TaxID=13288 RepID=A0AAU9S8M2_THLAR|nr:unnamed protein product [Thlaspi arvense]
MGMENFNGGLKPGEEWVTHLAWYGESSSDDGIKCEVHPAKVSSYGIWEKVLMNKVGLHFWQYRLPNLELVILLLFILWQFLHILLKKLGLLLNVLLTFSGDKSIIQEILFPKDRIDIPGCLGSFGFVIFWFLKGVKMDVKRVFKVGAQARLAGVASVTFSIIVGLLLYKLTSAANRPLKSIEYNTILIMESLTSFSEIARLLRDLDMNHSSISRVALSAASVSNMVGLMFLLGMNSLGLPSKIEGVRLLFEMSFFIIISFGVLGPIMYKVIKRKRDGRPIEDKYLYGILVIVSLASMFWDYLEQFPAFGAFFLGLAIPNGPPIGSALVERLESFNFGIIMPLFLSATMLRTDIKTWKDSLTFFSGDDKKFAVASLVLLIFLMKLIVFMIIPYLYKMSLKDSFIFSLIMSHKGVIELSFYFFSFGLEVLSRDSFSILVLSIFLNSVLIPTMVKFLYDPSKKFVCYQKRYLASTKNIGELKTLVCIHRPDHISSMINFLEVSYKSDECPLTCYVLHLVELQGQEVPSLVSHSVKKLGVQTGTKHSENVILAFQHFNPYACSSISIDTFTCIAKLNHMQEDICWLALDKAVTLIILPFHRTWSLDRTTILSDNEMIRFLNANVLKQAPCSVGILVERHLVNKKQGSQQNIQVCVIFVGGKDDREALAYAKRMALQENVTLTVLHLLASGNSKELTGWDQMLDTVDLREVIQSNDAGVLNQKSSITYLEQEIVDGTDLSVLLRSMAFDYSLFIVGRTCGENHVATKGIENWCEFEELGVIGDFLASPDYKSDTSVLIVQQQRTVANK